MGNPPGGGLPPGGGDPNNAGQFGTTNLTPGQSQTPANPAVTMDPAVYQQLNDKLSSMADKMASITGSVSQLSGVLAAALKPLSDLNKGVDTLGIGLKDAVNQSDDVKDRFKSLIDLYKKTSVYQTKNVKNLVDMKQNLQEMQKQAKDISKGGFLSPEAQRTLQRLLGQTDTVVKNIENDMKKLGKSADTALDPESVAEYNKEMQKLNQSLLGTINNTRKLGQTRKQYDKPMQNIRDNLPGLTQGRYNPLGYVDKYRGFSQAAFRIRGTRDARAAAAGGGNGGWIDRLAGGGALPPAAGGGGGRPPGGGGLSIGAKLGGIAEGGTAGIAGMIGDMAPILAGLEAVKEIFDKQTQMNRDVEKGLAAGGLFRAGGTFGGGNFVGARGALQQTGLAASGGLSYTGAYDYQKNLRTAQAMAEGGLNIGEFMKGNGPGAGQYTPGAMGTFQKNVYAGGRLAGLGEPETVQRTIKLLQQYRQSFTSTEDFFLTLSKNAEAAGLSTTKYLSILDSVTDGFDRLNKSFTMTMNAMELLGRTGRLSADDMKDYIDTLQGIGGKVAFTTHAFLYAQESQPVKQGAADARDYLVGQARDEVRKQTKGLIPEDVIKGLQTPEDISAAKAQYVDTANVDDITKKAANSVLDGLQMALAKAGLAHGLADKSITALGMATGTEATGQDFVDKMQATTDVLDQIEKRGGPGFLDQLRKNPASAGGLASTRARELGIGLAGTKPEDFLHAVNALQAVAESQTSALRTGTLPGGSKEAARIYDQVIGELGPKGLATATTDTEKEAALKDIANKLPGDLDKAISNSFSKDLGPNLQHAFAFHQQEISKDEKAAADATVAKAAEATRSTADIFAMAFDKLFNELWEPMVRAADGIEKLVNWFGAGKAATDAQLKTDADALQTPEELVASRILAGTDKATMAANLADTLSGYGAQTIGPGQFSAAANNTDILAMTQDKMLKGLMTSTTTKDATGKSVINITLNNVDATSKGMPAFPLPNVPGTETPSPRSVNPKVTPTPVYDWTAGSG